MWIYIKLAWRNIFRNKRRTLIAGSAIGIGLASMIFTDALVIGMEQNMIHSGTASYLGEGQIHRQGYRETNEIEMTVNDADEVYNRLVKDTLISHATKRVMSLAMLSSPSNVTGVQMVGVDPSTEQYLSQIDDALVKGEYFADSSSRNIVIGKDLAELLEVGLGDRVVITAAEAETGNLAQEMFRVSGIYFFNIKEMDKGMAFIRIGKARQMLNLAGRTHEIAFNFRNPSIAENNTLPFWKEFSTDGNEAVGWPVIMPQLKAALEMSSFSTYLVGIMLFSVVALGIINTLFMSLHERMFEFGVMRAIGTRPFYMGRLILLEAGSLAVISIVLGIILGYAITAYIGHIGIDYSGIEFAGVTFRNLLYPVMKTEQFIRFPIWVFIFTIVIGLYPAIYAARMRPASALRKSF